MAEFSQNPKYDHIWQNSKFANLALSGSLISQFNNDVGFITAQDIPASSGSANTGSLIETASFSDPNMVFIKGDKSSFNVDLSTLTVVNAYTASYIDGGTF